MDIHGWLAIATLLAASVLFVTRWLPIPFTAMAIPVVLYSTGVLADVRDALAGFGNLAVIAIAAVMIIGGALRESGVAALMAQGLTRVGGKGEFGLVILLMAATAFLAAFMNNTAVVAIFLPVAVALSRRAGVAPSRLMMPLAFATVCGATISLIGTAPNFLVADYYKYELNTGGDEIGVFDFAPVGIPITIAGILFMALVGRRLLPDIRDEGAAWLGRRPSEAVRSYGVLERLFEMQIPSVSGLVGKSIAESRIREKYGVGVIVVERPGALGSRKWLLPDPDEVLEAGDKMYLSGTDEAAWRLSEGETVQFGLASPEALETLVEGRTTTAEVTLPPHSLVIGRTLREIDFRKTSGLNAFALRRHHAPKEELISDIPLELGDTFLVSGAARAVQALQSNPDYIVLTDHSEERNVTRAPLAIFFLLLAVLPPVAFGFPLPISAMGAALLMIFSRCISRASLMQTMDWNVIFLIMGTMPLGMALQQRGVSGAVASWFGEISAEMGVVGIYGGLFLVAAVLSVLSSNAAAAVIMAPVAAMAAGPADVPVRNALLAMAFGCSCNFLLPFANCNIMVMTPGRYRTADYIRVGGLMSLVMAATTIAVLSLL